VSIGATTSQLGHERHIRDVRKMSARPPTPDISLYRTKRREGPEADKVHRGKAASFNHVVRGSEQRLWNTEAECLRRLEIDDQFEFGRLLDRQVPGL